nr:stage V sporulation protein B [Paenibacillus sp. YX.27]
MKKSHKQSFIQGTMILLAAGLINRMLGFIPRIVLPRVIGTEGVGLYQLGYPFFLVLVTVITGGLPLAVAKMVAEAESGNHPERTKSVLRTALGLSFGLGVFFTLVSFLAASWVSTSILTDGRVYYTFIAMSPMIAIVSISAVYRGYFQGKQNMIPSALSSVLETVARIVFMLWLSLALLPKGIEYAAAGAMLGVTAGEIAGMLVLLVQYFRSAPGEATPKEPADTPKASAGENPSPRTLRRLLRISVPVTAGRLVGSFSYLLESIVTARSLALAGVATSVATAQYGALQGMVIPLLLLPSALTSSLAVSLVPSLSEATARGDHRTVHKRMHQALRLALVTGAPFAVIMYVLAEPLCRLLYGSAETAPMLRLMAPFAVLLYVQAPLQAALQALDRPGRALMNTLIGAVVKIVLIFLLASRPEYGITGAILAIIVNSVLVTLLHGASVVSLLSLKLRLSDLLRIAAAMVIMAAGMTYMSSHFALPGPEAVRFLIPAVAGGALYIGIALLSGLLSPRDLGRLPRPRRR